VPSLKIATNLYLNSVSCQSPSYEVPVKGTHHALMIDVSGSMMGSLPLIRQQVKDKIFTMMKPKDTLSLGFFSGKGQASFFLKNQSIPTLAEKGQVDALIDRWMVPVGLTGFVDPMRLVLELAEEYEDRPINLVVLTDGMENSNPIKDVMTVTASAGVAVRSMTLVEYSYYADRALLTKMAEISGGSLIHSKDFVAYDAAIGGILGKSVSAKRKEVIIPDSATEGFAFTLRDGEIITYSIADNKVLVDESTKEVFFLTTAPSQPAEEVTQSNGGPVYALVSLFSARMRPDIVRPCLRALGDKKMIMDFGNAFGKQAYSNFMEGARLAAFNEVVRYADGYDQNAMPRDDATTVLDLLRLLNAEDENRLLLDHPEFSYNKISRSMVDDEDALVFEPAKDSGVEGYPFDELVFNESRANVSVRVKKQGAVTLPKDRPSPDKLPQVFSTFIYRNYSIVADGIVNVDSLPVVLGPITTDVINQLIEDGRLSKDAVKFRGKEGQGSKRLDEVILDLTKVPMVNASMIKKVSAKEVFTAAFELAKAKSAQKVCNYYEDQYTQELLSDNFVSLYGAEATQYLKDKGITGGGFNPKKEAAVKVDFYTAKELDIKLAGLSNIPKVTEAAGKKTISASLVNAAVKELEADMASEKNKQDFLRTRAKEQKAKCRELMYKSTMSKWPVLVAGVWYNEFSSLEENSLEMTFDGNTIKCQAVLSEPKVYV
jgi:hypothetical protein